MIESLQELTYASELKSRIDSLCNYAQRYAEAMAYERMLIGKLADPEMSLEAQAELDAILAGAQTIVDATIKAGFITQEQIDARLANDSPHSP